MSLCPRLTGSWVALPTPFDEKGAVNLDVFKELIDFHIAHHTDGLLVLGSAGENSMLHIEEKKEIIKEISQYARGHIPVLMGTTCCNTIESVNLTLFAQECNAYGALMVVPGYVRPPQDDILTFFKTVASSVNIPIAVYNNPTRVGVAITAQTAVHLAEIPNVVALKEAIPDFRHIIEVKKAVKDTIDILTCDSPHFSIILPNLSIGGSGTANITGNLAPEEFSDLSQPWKTFEDVERSRKLVFKLFELMQYCYSVTNPVVIKAGLSILGIDVGAPRPPLQELNKKRKKELAILMGTLGILEKYGM
jgi:4-hydroxy-tetrahydrodipicolinate synthase